ncbi:MAG: hypothetical protein ACYS9H_10420, partial [Planctomycetota bacterium]
LDNARLHITEGLETQQHLEEQINLKTQHAQLLSEQKTSLEFQVNTITDTLERVRNSYHELRGEHNTQTKTVKRSIH